MNITPAWWNVCVEDYSSVEALDGASLGAAITAAGMLDWSGARQLTVWTPESYSVFDGLHEANSGDTFGPFHAASYWHQDHRTHGCHKLLVKLYSLLEVGGGKTLRHNYTLHGMNQELQAVRGQVTEPSHVTWVFHIRSTGDVYEAQGFADLAMGLALATVSRQHWGFHYFVKDLVVWLDEFFPLKRSLMMR